MLWYISSGNCSSAYGLQALGVRADREVLLTLVLQDLLAPWRAAALLFYLLYEYPYLPETGHYHSDQPDHSRRRQRGWFVWLLHQRSAGDGPDQILRPFGHGHDALLTRGHVPHRAHAAREFVLTEYGSV